MWTAVEMMGGSTFITTFNIYLKDSISVFTWKMVTIERVGYKQNKNLGGMRWAFPGEITIVCTGVRVWEGDAYLERAEVGGTATGKGLRTVSILNPLYG